MNARRGAPAARAGGSLTPVIPKPTVQLVVVQRKRLVYLTVKSQKVNARTNRAFSHTNDVKMRSCAIQHVIVSLVKHLSKPFLRPLKTLNKKKVQI